MVLEPLSFESDARMALQLTEVQNLIIKRSASDSCVLRAFARRPAEMVKDPQGCRLWYEAELVPLGLNERLKAMGTARYFADSADEVADNISPGAVADLNHVVTNVVAALDQLGAHAPAADGLAAFAAPAPVATDTSSASDASLLSCASSVAADGAAFHAGPANPPGPLGPLGPGDQEEYW
jgi:hypothetical protein